MRLITLKYNLASESTIFFTVVLYGWQYFLQIFFLNITVVPLKGTCLGGLPNFLRLCEVFATYLIYIIYETDLHIASQNFPFTQYSECKRRVRTTSQSHILQLLSFCLSLLISFNQLQHFAETCFRFKSDSM